MYTGFWWGNLRERDHLEDLDLEMRIILKCFLHEVRCGGMDRIELAQDREQARVKSVMNLRVP